MSWFELVWTWLLPAIKDILLQGRVGLVIVTCLALTIGIIALLLTWFISGHLQKNTVLGAVVFTLILASIGALAHGGEAWLATWVLVGLLIIIISVVTVAFGVGSLSNVAYVIPIVLAASGLGFWAGLGVASIASTIIWLSAWAEIVGWYKPLLPRHSWQLTYRLEIRD